MDIKFKEVNGVKIAYKDVGNSQPLFCLPPYPSSSTAFVPCIKYSIRRKAKIRFIALDLPGFGGYSSLPKDNFTLEEFIKTIEDFILSFKF